MGSEDAVQQTALLIAIRDDRDKAAFSRLFDFYAPRLSSVIVRAGMDGARADETVQDVMLTIWQKAGQFDETRASASAWVFRIARNRMIDVMRRDRKAIPPELYEHDHAPETQAAELAEEQESTLLRAALERLPAPQRDMIERVYLGELTHQEVNAATGLPIGTIKSRIRLGLDRLRHELKSLRN